MIVCAKLSCKECGGDLKSYVVYDATGVISIGCYVCSHCRLVYIDIEESYKYMKKVKAEKKEMASQKAKGEKQVSSSPTPSPEKPK